MQAILRLKTECRAQMVYSVWWQGYRMADRATVPFLARTGNVPPSPNHTDQFLDPTTFLLKGYQGFNWGRGKVAKMGNGVPGNGCQLTDGRVNSGLHGVHEFVTLRALIEGWFNS